jgi:molybdopterin converting factor small subunit
VVRVVVANVLAAEAEGRHSFDVEAETLGDALQTLPFADLLFDERGEWNQWLNVYVDGSDVRDRGGLACSLSGAHEVRIVAMISGG